MGNKLTGQRCQCSACGGYFRAVSTFDKHRVGPYLDRKCLTSDEMKSRGWELDESGFWITGRNPRIYSR